jgi:hypothetical protein
MVEDLNAYLEAFGTDAVLDGQAQRVVFDNAYREAFDGVSTRQPMAQLPTAAAAAVTQDSRLVVGGVTFRVRSNEPDGTGWTILMLERLP